LKKRVAIFQICDILFSVMRDMDNTDKIEQGYEEVCTGCGETVCLSKEEHDQWDHGFDNFMCWECE
tara:strand:+ start:395 stop:592 length:198 start_codon:yes stop_codon:yes gene_type:complete